MFDATDGNSEVLGIFRLARRRRQDGLTQPWYAVDVGKAGCAGTLIPVPLSCGVQEVFAQTPP